MKVKNGLMATLAISMVLFLAFSAEARPFGPDFRGPGMEPGLDGVVFLLELKLSDSQQAQMLNIFNKYKAKRESLERSMMEAGRDMREMMTADQFNEEAARKAFRKSSAAMEEMFISRAKMMTELKAVLNPEQLELLERHKAPGPEKIKHRFPD